MSTHLNMKVTCDCGHQGNICQHEGDGPGKFWENYTLEGLKGKSLESETPVKLSDMLIEIEATCPKCRNSIQLKHVGKPVPDFS